MAQLVRAPPCHGGGRGFESLLGRSTKVEYESAWDHSSAGRAPALQAGGHRFEPYSDHCADVSQLAEQLTCNQQVIGSSPIVGFHGGIPEWPKGADCKSVAIASQVRILLRPLFFTDAE